MNKLALIGLCMSLSPLAFSQTDAGNTTISTMAPSTFSCIKHTDATDELKKTYTQLLYDNNKNPVAYCSMNTPQ